MTHISLSHRESEGAAKRRKGEGGALLTLTPPVLRASSPLPQGEGL